MALARPQTSFSNEKITSEGIDIIIAMDVSYSMMAEDFRPNRLSASKNDALQFIKSRPDDRIGLVMFAGESFTLCPATSDHTVLINELKDLGNEDGKLADGTAIGMGLATAVDRLRESQAKSKVVILLTDGVNNQGAIQPLDAADIAKKYGIRVYTIGVGTEGQALIPIPGGQKTLMDVEIDEALLKKIAKQTGGKYFRAKNDTELKGIYKEIDHLEKTKVEINAFHHKGEKFYIFAMISGLLLLLEMVLRYAVVRAIP